MNRLEKIWMRLAIIVAVVFGSSVLTMAAEKIVVIPLGNSNKVAELEARVAELERILTGVSRNDTELVFSAMNINIVDGSGDTESEVNGLGNLVVGYNEPRNTGNDRSGSHNLVVGSKNNYSSYGGFVAGTGNSVSGTYSSVSGGERNVASNVSSSVSGGYNNRASGEWSSVSAGAINEASNEFSSVSGGEANDASGYGSSVSGGSNNLASYYDSSVSGGFWNVASGEFSSVSGGHQRTVSAYSDWRAGGLFQDN